MAAVTALISLWIAAGGDAKPAPSLETLAPHAAGICLAEVADRKRFDDTPADGNAGIRFTLKVVRSSGVVRKQIVVITGFGGAAPPGAPARPKKLLIRAESLKKGKRYWFAFASEHELAKYPQGVINFWPELTPKVADLLDKAITAKRYRWRPQYYPKLGLTYGRLRNEELDHLRVRVTRNGKLLWEKTLSGRPTDRYFSWGLWESYSGFPAKLPRSGKILIAETETKLAAGNEFELPAKKYYVCRAFDPETGRRLAAWVSRNQTSLVSLVHRDYDPRTGKVRLEHRYDWHIPGGLKVGAKKDDWSRKTVRHYDVKTGRVTASETYRFDYARGAGKRWVKL